MMSLSNIKVGKRLALGFGTCLVLTMAIAIMAWWGLASLKQAADETQKDSEKALAAKSMAQDSAAGYLDIWHISASNNQSERLEHKSSLEKVRGSYSKKFEDLKAQLQARHGKQFLRKIEDAFANARETNFKVVELGMQGNSKEAILLLSGAGRQKMMGINQAIGEFCDFLDQRAKESQHAMEQLHTRVLWLLGILALLAVVLTVFFALIITRSITGQSRL